MDNRSRFITIAVGAAAFVAGVITTTIVESGSSDGSQPQVITATQTVFPPPTYAADPPTPSASASPVATGKSVVVLTESGSGDKSTQTFTVTGDWDLRYSYSGSVECAFAVHTDSGDSLVDEFTTGNADTTHQHAGGAMSLKIIASCPWKLKVIQLP